MTTNTRVMDDDNSGREAELWMVLAFIQPFRLDAVMLALEDECGFGGMSVSDCRGFGRARVRREPEEMDTHAAGGGVGVPRLDAAGSFTPAFTAKVRIEIAIAGRENTEAIVRAIAAAAHTGRRGDGKIFAWPLATAVRIRGLERGPAAL